MVFCKYFGAEYLRLAGLGADDWGVPDWVAAWADDWPADWEAASEGWVLDDWPRSSSSTVSVPSSTWLELSSMATYLALRLKATNIMIAKATRRHPKSGRAISRIMFSLLSMAGERVDISGLVVVFWTVLFGIGTTLSQQVQWGQGMFFMW